jgi:hypothetical protein
VVLDVTAKDLDESTIFNASRIYVSQATDSRSNLMTLGPERKLGFIRDTAIQPFAPKEETFEVPVSPGVREAVVEVKLTYRPRPGSVYPIHHVINRVRIDQAK